MHQIAGRADIDAGVGPSLTCGDHLLRVERRERERVVGWTGQTRMTGAPSWFSSFTRLPLTVSSLHHQGQHFPFLSPTPSSSSLQSSIDFASLSDDDGGLKVSSREKSPVED